MEPSVSRISDPNTPWLAILIEFGFQNKPFILENWSTSSWSARKNWVREDGSPNVEYFEKHYGDSVVPLLVGGSCYKSSILSEYLKKMKESENPEVYLKDWHFQNEFGTSMYALHPFFSRDFVNCESWTSNKTVNPFGDDYRFVYFGTDESWTKFHSDVVSSHSWSANICGRKQWFMMPPGSEKEHFRDRFSESGFVDDIRKHSEHFDKAQVITFIQEPGEIVFVPSNWYHQVHNLTDTISINHNWVNSTNLRFVKEFLDRRTEDVRNELSDCIDLFSKEEFEEKVELVLFADARLNKTKFKRLCELVRDSRAGVTDEFNCKEHGTDLSRCISSPSCHFSILSICSCSTEMCPKCLSFIQQLEFSMLTDDHLSVLYDCATTSKRLPADFAKDQNDLSVIIRYGEIFKACHSASSTEYIQKSESLDDREKLRLQKIVNEKLKEASKKTKNEVEWNVNIVVGNSHVAKSLRPVINIKMPTVEGQTFEFDIDSFAQFRQQLARAVLAVNPQE